MREKLEEYVKLHNIDAVINCIDQICMSLDSLDDCFDTIIDLLLSTEDKNIINAIDWGMLSLEDDKSILDKCIKVINHKNYEYSKIKMMTHLNYVIFQNEKISTELYLFLLLKDVKHHRRELYDLLNNTDIYGSLIKCAAKDKVNIFYKTIGLSTVNVEKNMKICFDILMDDKVVELDREMVLVFARFYAWNYINTSSKFIIDVKIKSSSQKLLIDTLKSFVFYYLDEQNKIKLSKDFLPCDEVNRAIRRINYEQNKLITEESSKKSILLELFEKQIVLLGNRVCYFDSGSKVFDFREIAMQEFSYEKEIALDALNSPIDFAFTIDFLLNGD